MSDADDPRYEVKNPAVEEMLLGIGRRLAQILEGTGMGFTLFLFDYGPGGSTFYISSGQRDDIQKMLREFLKREGGH